MSTGPLKRVHSHITVSVIWGELGSVYCFLPLTYSVSTNSEVDIKLTSRLRKIFPRGYFVYCMKTVYGFDTQIQSESSFVYSVIDHTNCNLLLLI